MGLLGGQGAPTPTMAQTLISLTRVDQQGDEDAETLPDQLIVDEQSAGTDSFTARADDVAYWDGAYDWGTGRAWDGTTLWDGSVTWEGDGLHWG